jgi:hypothetical protein
VSPWKYEDLPLRERDDGGLHRVRSKNLPTLPPAPEMDEQPSEGFVVVGGDPYGVERRRSIGVRKVLRPVGGGAVVTNHEQVGQIRRR